MESDHEDSGFNDSGSFIFYIHPSEDWYAQIFYYGGGQNCKLEPDLMHKGMTDDPLPSCFSSLSDSVECLISVPLYAV